jgi:hypothetical protein
MPFKSEEQRRYLWANEPEIARDWTDTYGSKIKKADGGISQLVKSSGSDKRPGYRGGDAAKSDRDAGRSAGRADERSGVERGGPDRREQYSKPTVQYSRPTTVAQRDIEAGVGTGGRGSLADPMEKQDYTTQKYTGSFLDNVFNQGYRPVTPTGQFQSRLSQYGGNILSGIMGAINPFLGILSRGFQNFRDTPYLQDYISNLRPRQMSDVFVDQGRGSGIKNIPMEENIIPLSKPTSLYNLDDMLMSKPVSSKSPMADPMWGGIMNVDTGLINDYDPEDRSTWFDTHPATGEAVLKPETGYDYTDLNKRGYSAHEFDQRPWDKTQIGVRPYRYNYSEMVQKPPLWWKWLPKM